MFPPQAHGPEQDVAQHLLRGSEQFAFGLVDDSFETRAVGDERWRLRPSSPRASRLHLLRSTTGAAAVTVPTRGRPARKANELRAAVWLPGLHSQSSSSGSFSRPGTNHSLPGTKSKRTPSKRSTSRQAGARPPSSRQALRFRPASPAGAAG